MIPNRRISTHPGEALEREFLDPLELTQTELARHLGVPIRHVYELVRGTRGVTPDTAWLPAQAFDTTPEFWMDLQVNHDLSLTPEPKGIRSLVAR